MQRLQRRGTSLPITDRAIPLYQAIELNQMTPPQPTALHCSAALQTGMRGESDRAVQTFRARLQITPNHVPDALYSRGLHSATKAFGPAPSRLQGNQKLNPTRQSSAIAATAYFASANMIAPSKTNEQRSAYPNEAHSPNDRGSAYYQSAS